MKISKQSRREAKELFRHCIVNASLDEARVRQVVQQVLTTRPRGYLAMLGHFQRLVKLHLEQRTARIESPAPLSEQEKSALASRLNQRYGGNLIFNYSENPGLLGGLRIRVGSDVFDGSVRARLDAIEEGL
jgi:F-type H+-transporting ATPase subunit delta